MIIYGFKIKGFRELNCVFFCYFFFSFTSWVGLQLCVSLLAHAQAAHWIIWPADNPV